MQVYRPQDAKYLFRDKYFGRELDPIGFHANLRDYLWYVAGHLACGIVASSDHMCWYDGVMMRCRDGTRVRTEIASQLLSRLLPFQHVLAHQPAVRRYRFYSSSLLLVYEGYEPEYDSNKQFAKGPTPTAQSVVASPVTPVTPSTPSADQKKLKLSEPIAPTSTGSGGSGGGSAAATQTPSKLSHSTSATLLAAQAAASGGVLPSGVYATTLASLSEADVRIIDFAHTTKLAGMNLDRWCL